MKTNMFLWEGIFLGLGGRLAGREEALGGLVLGEEIIQD